MCFVSFKIYGMIDQNVVDYIYYDKLYLHTVILKVTN